MRIVIVTGLSGAGKSTVLRALEDIGVYCVDNIPLPQLASLVEFLQTTHQCTDVAISLDSRQQQYLGNYHQQIAKLREDGYQVEVLFLEAKERVLISRYSETRRRHPLAGDDLAAGIRRDEEVLSSLRHGAAVVNTSALNVHELKALIQERYGRREGNLAVTLLSFGFRRGVPPEADLVFDVRFLRNPYFESELSGLDGREPRVKEYVFHGGDADQLVAHLETLLNYALPRYEAEGKLYLTIAIGCTGGRHRSVAVVEELHHRIGAKWDAVMRHRDLQRGV